MSKTTLKESMKHRCIMIRQKAREYADRLGVILFNKLPIDFSESERKQFEDFIYKKGEFEEK